MAHPRDTRNESLQCVALAMRQQLNRKIDENDLMDFLKWARASYPTNWRGFDRTAKQRRQKSMTQDYRKILATSRIPSWLYTPSNTYSFIRWIDTETLEEQFDPEADREFLSSDDYEDIVNQAFNLEGELFETPIRGSHLDDWTKSCTAIANKITDSQYLRGGGYIFVMDAEIEVKKVASDLLKDAADNMQDPKIKRALKLAAGGSADKWNPADIFAVKKGFLTTLKSALKTRKWRTNKQAIVKMNKELDNLRKQSRAMRGSKVAEQNIRMQEDMGHLYTYNQYIDENYVSRECVPISLKKTSSLNPPIKLMRHKEGTGVINAVNLDLKITKVDYKPDAAKTIVEFSIAGKKGWMLDMRGFESGSKGGLQEIQMQLQHGTDASHGKLTLPVYSFIVKESGGMAAINRQRQKRREIFGDYMHSTPISGDHLFTPASIFNEYANKVPNQRTWPMTNRDRFNQQTLLLDAPLWAQYIQWLTSGTKPSVTSLGNNDVIRQFRRKLGDPAGSAIHMQSQTASARPGVMGGTSSPMDKNLATVQKNVSQLAKNWPIRNGQPVKKNATDRDYKDAAKYLKNKVQSAEAGFIVDLARPHIKEMIKNNIMKSAYTYAASKGLTIWGEMGGVEELVSSSTYVKVGG